MMLGVPVVTPSLSSYWIAMMTRSDLRMARELVEGLREDLDPQGEPAWPRLPRTTPSPLDDAIDHALADESAGGLPSADTRRRILSLVEALPGA
jgi:hypothetical protein